MENYEDDNFRKLIKNAGTDKPGAYFTENILKMIEDETQKELAVNASLQNLLHAHLSVEKPSRNFNRIVMKQIRPSQARKLEPIISRNAWYIIAASVLLTIVMYTFVDDTQGAQRSISGMEQFLNNTSSKIETLPILYPATIFCVGFLMLADYILRESRAGKFLNI